MKLLWSVFTSDSKSWDELCHEVALFVQEKNIAQDRIVSISVSEYGQYMSTGTIILWYYEQDPDALVD